MIHEKQTQPLSQARTNSARQASVHPLPRRD